MIIRIATRATPPSFPPKPAIFRAPEMHDFTAADPQNRFFLSADGLKLHYFEWPSLGSGLAPVVCLPGLARPADDFDALAAALAGQGRRVLALDHRGRGASQWDEEWRHYDLDVEQDDIMRFLADAGVSSAAFIGTSRGGLHMMRLAKSFPGLLRSGVLNDIGPEIPVEGLLAIKRYVGKLPALAKMEDAIGLMRLTAGEKFSAVSAAEWEIFARHTFEEKNGRMALRYDPALAHTLDDVEENARPADFWEGFDALAQGPLLTLRGENSDILTPDILRRMAERAPKMEQRIIAGQAHAPLLLDAPTIAAVVDFIRRTA
jgi:pimeloyl-ACP methyl ester carboxylesterase